MSRRPEPTHHHYCNALACPTCVARFYAWAERWTRGSPTRSGPSFYEAAGRFIGEDARRLIA